MQNWKIKKMSYQELIGHQKAISSMLYYYQRGEDFPTVCQLCKVSRTYHRKVSNACVNCLWKIIEGESCAQFAIRKIDRIAYVPALTDKSAWHKLRIPMLRRWAKVIQAEMDNRTEGEA